MGRELLKNFSEKKTLVHGLLLMTVGMYRRLDLDFANRLEMGNTVYPGTLTKQTRKISDRAWQRQRFCKKNA